MTDVKKPQDHKSTHFEWKTPDGKTIKLKAFGRVDAGVFRRVRNMSDLDATFELLEAGADKANLALIDKLAYEEVDTLFIDWSKGEQVTAPQS